jgi:ribosome-binding protein aMBF1 (putative translation factor)
MTLYDQYIKDPRRARGVAQTGTQLRFTELVCKLLKEKGMSRLQLARKLGVKKAVVDAMLDSFDQDISLREASDMLFFLGFELEFSVRKKT